MGQYRKRCYFFYFLYVCTYIPTLSFRDLTLILLVFLLLLARRLPFHIFLLHFYKKSKKKISLLLRFCTLLMLFVCCVLLFRLFCFVFFCFCKEGMWLLIRHGGRHAFLAADWLPQVILYSVFHFFIFISVYMNGCVSVFLLLAMCFVRFILL